MLILNVCECLLACGCICGAPLCTTVSSCRYGHVCVCEVALCFNKYSLITYKLLFLKDNLCHICVRRCCLCHIPYPGRSCTHATMHIEKPAGEGSALEALLRSASKTPMCRCLSCKSKTELPITCTGTSNRMKISHGPRTSLKIYLSTKTHARAGGA